MRRSTAAAIGTLTGAALIVGVRLSVQPPAAPAAAPPSLDLADSKPSAAPPAPKKPVSKKPAAPKGPFKDGVYKGDPAKYAYGAIQVQIKVEGGQVSAADATYPVAQDSGTINPPAIAKLKQETVGAKSAKDLDAVSGASLTTEAYRNSLQSALDAAKA
nr:FMN-binding protein [uncultured Actinoplanes sp.]